MQIRICDRCKKEVDWSYSDTNQIFHIQYEGNTKNSLEWWLGSKHEFDLCTRCFKEFMEFKKT